MSISLGSARRGEEGGRSRAASLLANFLSFFSLLRDCRVLRRFLSFLRSFGAALPSLFSRVDRFLPFSFAVASPSERDLRTTMPIGVEVSGGGRGPSAALTAGPSLCRASISLQALLVRLTLSLSFPPPSLTDTHTLSPLFPPFQASDALPAFEGLTSAVRRQPRS